MKQDQRERIKQHGHNLLAIFTNATERDPVALCKKLRRIEANAYSIGLQMCSGPEMTEKAIEHRETMVFNALAQLLGKHDVPVFINKDPRGYAMKISDRWMTDHKAVLHKDWGGYGILAPEIE